MASLPFTFTSNPPQLRFSNPTQNGDPNSLLLHISDYFPEISSLSKQGKIREAVRLFTHMELRGIQTRHDIYGELLQGCVYERDLFLGRQFHARIVKNGDSFSENDFLETKLVILYSKCDDRVAAARMFRSVSSQNLFSWAAIIGLNCRMGFCEEALYGFREMLERGFSPDNFVLPNALKACGARRCVGTGKQVHGYAVKMGFGECVFVTSSLVDMYGKCSCLGEARKVFDKKSDRNVVTWNSLIVGNVQNGMNEEALKTFRDMRIDGVEPTQVTISSFLSASANLGAVGEGKQGHALAILQGLDMNTILGSSIVNFYSKVGLLDEAQSVFARTVNRDTVTWNLIVSGYVQTGDIENALAMCSRMRSENLRFDAVTLSSLISTSAKTADLKLGAVGHCYCIRNNFESDVIAASTIVNMYAKCKRLDRARRVFDSVKRGDIVLWNTMLASYAESGLSGEALKLFYRMELENVPPNVVSYNSLISGLLKNGQVSEASEMFHQMESLGITPNVVTWTTLVSGLAENGFGREAVEKFLRMQEHRIRPNVVSLVSVLSACIDMALLNYGKAIHGYSVRNLNPSSSTPLVTSLIDMYAKCGNSDGSKKIFDSIKDKETPIYNVMIACHALHGQAEEALELYEHLKKEGKRPDSVTLTNALNACSHAGLVNEALGLFSEMVSEHDLKPTMAHYGCVVRLLSKFGLVDEAFGVLGSMAFEPDAHILGSLLDACKASNEVELAEYLSEKLMELDPQNSGNYVALSNAYAAAGKWDRVERVRRLMRDKGLVKSPGCSWIQIGDDFRLFVAGDKSHPETLNIYSTLSLLGF